MKRAPAVVIVLGVVAVLLWASVARVPDDSGAWCRGRYLGPGLQLKAPFARVERFERGDHEVSVSRPGDDGRSAVKVEVTYRWDFSRLPGEPVPPSAVEDRVTGVVADTGDTAWVSGVTTAVRDALSDLPVEVVALDVDAPDPRLDRLREIARPTGDPVVVVGFDGLDWVLLDRLIDEGRCPTFARMKREGAWGEIISRPPVLSPLIWTTMATGRLPEDHGVTDFVVTDAATGREVPITNQSRKVHAFWNIMTYAGIPVNVVNWWATYPAEDIDGVMVTERVFYQLFGIRPSLDDPANMSPAEVREEILPLLVSADDISYDEVREYVDLSPAEFDAELAEAKIAENPYDNRVNHLRKIIAVTRGVFNVGSWLLEHRPAALTALYVEGTDTIGHRFAHFLPPKLDWVSQRDYDRYHEAMARYYELCDQLLGELMERAPDETTWIVVPDHGFFTGAARPSVEPDDFTVGAPQWHRMVGAFLAAGPDVRPGKLPYVHIDDLCRTLLWLTGAPISRELRGAELEAMMRDEWVAAHPPVEVATYRDLPMTWMRDVQRSELLDDARLQELQALGYVDAAPEPTPAPGPGDTEARATDPYNRGRLAMRRGDYDAAIELFEESLAIDPEFPASMIGLADVYRQQGRQEERLRWILRALGTGGQMLPPGVLLEFVAAADAAGRLDRVLPALDMIRPRWQDEATYYTARGRALVLQGDERSAVAEYERALERDPADAMALDELLDLADRGVDVDATGMLTRAMDAVWNDLKSLNSVAVVCLRRGQPALAERALRRVHASDPTNPGVVSNLAVALQMQGDFEGAADVLADAVRARPDVPDLQFNLGAVLAALGRNEEAIEHLEAAERLGDRSPELLVAQAKVLVRMGRVDDGRRVLEDAATLYPDHQEIHELLGILRAGM